MITYPIAKINLGLNVVERRPDGYHNLETVFFPVHGLYDTLEVTVVGHAIPDVPSPNRSLSQRDNKDNATLGSIAHYDCDLTVANLHIEGDVQRNLVVRAYQLLKEEFPSISRVHSYLYKAIPTQAGMGGGSSDCAAMLSLLNELFSLGLTQQQLIDRAARLGADCPFFILNRPAYAEGIGERLQPIDLDLSGWHLAVVRPDIPVPTKEAFSLIRPAHSKKCCRDIVAQPVATWRDELTNDFEQSVFALHPEIGAIKQRLYELGATYAAMSGSGSAVFGLFTEMPDVKAAFPDMFVWSGVL